MLKYKTIKVTVPADGEASDVILSVASGEKVTLKGLGNNRNIGCIVFLEIEGDRFIRVPHNLDAGYGEFIPLNIEITGPENITVGAESVDSSSGDIMLTLMYEE